MARKHESLARTIAYARGRRAATRRSVSRRQRFSTNSKPIISGSWRSDIGFQP
jgi:hypothetical protein